MLIFKSYTYNWWQVGLLKLSLFAFGIAAGTHWRDVFLPYIALLLGVGIVLGIYVALVSFRQ